MRYRIYIMENNTLENSGIGSLGVMKMFKVIVDENQESEMTLSELKEILTFDNIPHFEVIDDDYGFIVAMKYCPTMEWNDNSASCEHGVGNAHTVEYERLN